MAIVNGYASLVELRQRLDINSAEHNEQMERAIEAASRLIDRMTGRRFYANAGTRYYTPDNGLRLIVDDIAVTSGAALITSIKTDDDWDGVYETTWAASDYYLLPDNHGEIDRPVFEIEVNPNGRYAWPTGVRRGVEIVGTFGWSIDGNPPTDIIEATLLAASQLFKRRDTIYGVSGTPALGVVTVQTRMTRDAHFMDLITPYRRRVLSYR